MEISNCYKGTDNVTTHAVEHDIVLTHDIVFDYIKTGKISPVINFNYLTGSNRKEAEDYAIKKGAV
jgi:hypothetical protein